MRAGLIPSRMLQEKRIAYERANSANNNGDSLVGKYQNELNSISLNSISLNSISLEFNDEICVHLVQCSVTPLKFLYVFRLEVCS